MTLSRILHALVLLLSGLTVPALGQDPTSLSVSPSLVYLPPASTYCYTINVGNGANMIADIKYTLNSGTEQIIENWPDLDAYGKRYVCTDSATVPGIYTFTGVRRHGSSLWLTANAALTVAATPPQPSSLTFNGSASSAGYAGNDAYVLHAGNAAGMTLDFVYTVNNSEDRQAMVTLNGSGDWNYTLQHFDELGPWHFKQMKNHLRSDWVSVNATYTILPPRPTSASVSPASVMAGRDAYTWTVGNGASTVLDIQYTLTANGVEGPLLRINGWPQLGAGTGATGQASISVGPCTALGTYRFKWIKNTSNPDSTAITVNTAVTVTSPAAPVVTSVAPTSLRAGTTGSIAIFGSGLCGATLSSSSPWLSFAAIPDDPASTGASLVAAITVSANAQPGPVTIQMVARGGSTTFAFNISSSGPPTITSINPLSVGSGNTQLTVAGTNLVGATLSISWAGVSFGSYTWDSQGTTLAAQVSVSASAPPGVAVMTAATPMGSASTPLVITAGGPAISSSREYVYLGSRVVAVDTSSGQPVPPSPPAQFTGQPLNAYTVQLQWQPAAAAPGMTINAYQIKRGSSVIATVGGGQLSYLDTSASQNTSYTYRAIAQDNWTPSPQVSVDSNSAAVTTPRETTPPTAPTGLNVPYGGDTWMTLAWHASTDSGGSGLSGYYLYFTGSPDPISALITDTLYVIDFNWWPGLDWSSFSGFDVRAVDNAGNSSQAGHWP